MKGFSGILNEALDSFSYSVAKCCGWSDEVQVSQHHGSEKNFMVLRDQPSFIPPPSVDAMKLQKAPFSTWEQAPRKRQGSGFSARRRFFSRSSSSSASRRPQISAPTNFVHVYSGSYGFLDLTAPQRRVQPRSFRPLQLSIYQPNNQLTPILPHFDTHAVPPVTPPQRALTYSHGSPSTFTLSPKKSVSSMSFHVPRKSVISGGSVFDSPISDVKPPPPARVRSYTTPERSSPAMEDLIERIAKAMVERDRLQERIDDVIERQSICLSSRPSTATGMRPGTAISIMDMEPLPEVPALPPDAPSFSERLSIDRPRTAPPVQMQSRTGAFPDRTPAQRSPYAYHHRRPDGEPLPPPLPLRLRPPIRPPLRKKKSFSRVSSWLGFPEDQRHSRDVSIDSVTNRPMPIHAGDGYYQVATTGRTITHQSSFDTDDSESDWTSEADAEENQTVPTSCSPSSSATVRPIPPARNIVLGQAPPEYRHSRVGVAF